MVDDIIGYEEIIVLSGVERRILHLEIFLLLPVDMQITRQEIIVLQLENELQHYIMIRSYEIAKELPLHQLRQDNS